MHTSYCRQTPRTHQSQPMPGSLCRQNHAMPWKYQACKTQGRQDAMASYVWHGSTRHPKQATAAKPLKQKVHGIYPPTTALTSDKPCSAWHQTPHQTPQILLGLAVHVIDDWGAACLPSLPRHDSPGTSNPFASATQQNHSITAAGLQVQHPCLITFDRTP
jgi:hypothetical protein